MFLYVFTRNPDIRVRLVAEFVGIAERQVFTIISDPEESGLVKRMWEGRRKHDEVCFENNLHNEYKTVRDLINILLSRNVLLRNFERKWSAYLNQKTQVWW